MSHHTTGPTGHTRSLAATHEPLEPRRLLAAAPPTLDDGLLTVFGSGGSDHILISRQANDASRIVINVNSAVTTFSADSVDTILVLCGKGNDDAIVDQRNGLFFQRVTMLGGLGHDTLAGGNGRDSLVGGDDNDILAGAGRSDVLDGGNGHDNLFGGARRDLLIGGDGEDLLVGGYGADTCRGGLAGDMIISGNGNDVLEGEDGNDQLRGQSGNDTIRGAAGEDDLFGALGADQLFGGADNDDFFALLSEIRDAGDDQGANETEPSTFRSSGI